MTACMSERGFRPADVPAILELVCAARLTGSPSAVLHPGDVQWQLARLRDVAADVQVWEGDAGLAGFAVSDSATGEVAWLSRPRALGLGAAALAWAVGHLRAVGVGTAEAMAADDDAGAVAALERHGFVRGERFFVELRRDLGPAPPPEPPRGFRLATLATAGSAEALVELHRDAWARWGPSSYSLDAHRRLEAMPGYDPGLVAVAVGGDGRLASSCVCWLDTATLVGLIEPLGTGRAFGRRGLARAIVLEACRLLRARGMRTASVGWSSVNAPALALYSSVGFRPGRRSSTWTLRVPRI